MNDAVKFLKKFSAEILICFVLLFGTFILYPIISSLVEAKVKTPICSVQNVKPSYESLKAHTVIIYGCTGDVDASEKLVFPLGEDSGCWEGTGVVVKITDKETYVLTNNHVAGKGTEEPILFVKNEEQKIHATIVKYHRYVDMAIIKIPKKIKDKVAINKISIPEIQEAVYIVGNPLGNNYVYTEGIMAGYVGISYLFQAPCIYGNSGSGIFNANGDLVGLVYALQAYPGWMSIPEAQITYSIAVDSLSIEFFLKDLGLYNE